MKVHDSLNVDVLNHVVQRRIDMSHRNKALVAIVAGTALLIRMSVVAKRCKH